MSEADGTKPQIQEVGTGDTRDKPIKLGGALFTMVEPHKGHEVAYNRWYERDHFYAGCMIGAWNITGGRFVATKECKAKRYPADSPICPDPTSGSYLAVYWILAGQVRRVDPVGHEPGQLAARQRPHVPGARPRPHAHVQVPRRGARRRRRRARPSSRSTAATPASCS